jgi:hypothetical protein
MKKNTFPGVLLISLICLGQASIGQEREYIIPFTLTSYNNLSVEAILNKKDTVHLMFHTASNSVDLTEETTGKLKSLNFEGADSVKSWGGPGNVSRFSKSNSLQIGELNWENIPIWEDKNSGRGTDGKFGTELFKDKVIEIDFDKKVIVVRTSLPEKAKKYRKLKLLYENHEMFIEAICKIGGSVFKNKFLLHSGYSGAVLFDDKFADETKIGEKLKIIDEKELKDSFGHVLKTKKAILPTLIIGNEKLSDVPVGFFQGAIGRQKMSIIGGDILKRFNIIIDAQREYIYLKADKLKRAAYLS